MTSTERNARLTIKHVLAFGAAIMLMYSIIIPGVEFLRYRFTVPFDDVRILSVAADERELRLSGTFRKRACTFVALTAFTRHDGTLYPAPMRFNVQSPRPVTHELQGFSDWIVRSLLPDPASAIIYAIHTDCPDDGRRMTPFADIPWRDYP